jgi:hypothetical protein
MIKMIFLCSLCFFTQIFASNSTLKDWYCICYSELNDLNQKILVTSCRNDFDQCMNLAEKIAKLGSKSIIKGSAISSCVKINGLHPSNALIKSQKDDWLDSKLKGALWSPNGCFLDEQMLEQNPRFDDEEIIFHQKLEKLILNKQDHNWEFEGISQPEIEEIKKNEGIISDLYRKIINKKEMGIYQEDKLYFQLLSEPFKVDFEKEEINLLKNYYKPFEGSCDKLEYIHSFSSKKNMKLKRLGWLNLDDTYYLTYPSNIKKVKIIELGFESGIVSNDCECSTSELVPYYKLNIEIQSACSIISNKPLKYSNFKKIKEIELSQQSNILSNIEKTIKNNIKNIIKDSKYNSLLESQRSSYNLINDSHFLDESKYSIKTVYELSSGKIYVLMELRDSEIRGVPLQLIFSVNIEKNNITLLYFYQSASIDYCSITIQCEIDHNQDGQMEIPIFNSCDELPREEIIENEH